MRISTFILREIVFKIDLQSTSKKKNVNEFIGEILCAKFRGQRKHVLFVLLYLSSGQLEHRFEHFHTSFFCLPIVQSDIRIIYRPQKRTIFHS